MEVGGTSSRGSSHDRRKQRRVGLLYDERMRKHSTPDEERHPENPDRISSIWNMLRSAGIPQRCVVFNAKEADEKYILSVHSKHHIDLIKNISSKQCDSTRNKMARKFNSIYFNVGSSEAAYLAAGSVIEVAERVVKGELESAFAIVRPPGHHAEYDEPMGFCLFNNVAIAANFLLNERPGLGVKKILIVDWDVHHGNGTQKTFWNDSRVLFFSVHRHEFGTFYPANDDGSYTMTGGGLGKGFNINVPWENERCGDADYLAVWDHILIPVAKDFNPDIIIISAGFDAALGDPLGGCCVTPGGYSLLLKKLMDFAKGKIIMVLEGGYNLDSLAKSVLACVEVLLEDKPIVCPLKAHPFDSTWRVIQAVRQELKTLWPILADELPKVLISSQTTPFQHISSPESDSEDNEVPHISSKKIASPVEDLIKPLSDMKVNEDSHEPMSSVSNSWRHGICKVDVWYASFGSNMLQSRFLCYIEGGQVEGMKRPCSGSVDKSPPKETKWRIVRHRLFFGHDSSSTWGKGGVAFLHHESSNEETAHICLYRITLEQFNDILFQENHFSSNTSCLFGPKDLENIQTEGSNSREVLNGGWYRNICYLGNERDIPIITMTCSPSDVMDFKSGRLPLCAPSKEYATVLVKGLVEGRQLSEKDAWAYIEDSYSNPF